MQVRDRKKLGRLMVIQEVTWKELAVAAGWGPKSHSIVGRILSGKVTTVTPERAIRIANHLKVPVDDLFATRLSSDARQPAKSKKAA